MKNCGECRFFVKHKDEHHYVRASRFVTIALADYGGASASVLASATQYLTDNLPSIQNDPYALAMIEAEMPQANQVSQSIEHVSGQNSTPEDGNQGSKDTCPIV